jgi:hypothetical protein
LSVFLPNFSCQASRTIVAGGEAFDGEGAVFGGDGVEGVVDDADVGLHPGMEVALEGGGDLALLRGPLDGLAAGGWTGLRDSFERERMLTL